MRTGVDIVAGHLNPIELLTFALSERRTTVSDPTGSVTIEITADGAIQAIRLSDNGRRMTAEHTAEMIRLLHGMALSQAQQAVEAAVGGLEGTQGTDAGLAAASVPEPPLTEPALPIGQQPATQNAEEVPQRREPTAPKPLAHSVPDAHQPRMPATSAPQELVSASRSSYPQDRSTSSTVSQDIPAYEGGHDFEEEDEDEYYQQFSIVQEDDHRPGRGSRQ
ncbi:hypothetical protein [Nocardia sp. NPDC050710]|uniref:hypothetical protein n=1 Tax=Nocardia sp. NPDC050710 TaxID=3157220 RepID=UPI0033FD2A97